MEGQIYCTGIGSGHLGRKSLFFFGEEGDLGEVEAGLSLALAIRENQGDGAMGEIGKDKKYGLASVIAPIF